MSTTAFLEARGISLSFARWGQKVAALTDVDLAVPRGQWVMLVGPNGAGKTTLLNVISSRVSQDAGRVSIDGKEIGRTSPAELCQRVFSVHQDPLLGTAPVLTVYENLLIADHDAQIAGESKRSLRNKYAEMLSPLGLDDRLKQQARTLSGGERQLLALLIARLRPASVILLDEPLAALDPNRVDIALNELDGIKRAGKTIIQVSHNIDLSSTLGDRTVGMANGRIVYDEAGSMRSESAIREVWYTKARGS